MTTDTSNLTKPREIVEWVNGQSVTYWLMPKLQYQWEKFARYKLVNCGCAAYAKERERLTAEIQSMLRNGELQNIPLGSSSIVETPKLKFSFA